MLRRPVLLIPSLLLLTGCATSTFDVPDGWRSVPQARAIGGVAFAGTDVVGTEAADPRADDGPIVVAEDASGARLANGLRMLTEPFEAIESLSYSPSRGEVVFSARRDGDFDIGLVSSDGSAVNWLPDDPADEVAVQWAPRGNKVSYVIRAHGGDVVRTFHVPTSFQFAIPFPHATIRTIAWEPGAERYAVAYSTPDASDRVEVLEYDGGKRRVVIRPAESLAVEIQPIARDVIALRPHDIAYGERLPLVIWVADDFAWSDARAALMRDAKVAMVVTRRQPDAGLIQTLGAEPWIDAAAPWVVSAEPVTLSGARVVIADASLPAGKWRRTGDVVSVAPRVVQSFAARFITDHLKRTIPPHGSSR